MDPASSALGGQATLAARSNGNGSGSVYTMSNGPAGNEVLVFDRGADGSLTPAGAVATGGTGTGSGLGNQGAVTLTQNGKWLLVVNPASNDVSVFAVRRGVLRLTDRVGSGGTLPISVTVSGNLVYVLNAGGDGNISGFRLGNGGSLTALSGSTRSLSGSGVGPAQVGFSRGGDVLVVTEKATNTITTYLVAADGRPSAPIATPSSGQTPFGFSFDHRGRLVVSEAFGGAPGASAASLYDVRADGTLDVLSATVGNTQAAACWVIISQDGRFAYTTNTGSGSVSGFRIGSQGGLSLLDADGRTGVSGDGTSPIDGAVSNGGRFMYVLLAGSDAIGAFEVGPDGSLSPIPGASALPDGASGLAAR